jgi:hypothetical protein
VRSLRGVVSRSMGEVGNRRGDSRTGLSRASLSCLSLSCSGVGSSSSSMLVESDEEEFRRMRGGFVV